MIQKWWWLLINSSSCHPLSTAAQSLGTGDLWENRGARPGLGAEPQVHQHLPHEDTGHVKRHLLKWKISSPCAGRSVADYIFVVVQQLGEALCHWCFYTHTCWISTNQRLTFFLNLLYRICSGFYCTSLLLVLSFFF